ncbi:G-box-binding factor-like [Uranotaenia lowii]|uniref:G-box-binding factor-like n=1 Tax=Uranotaenia lowii TaxID=190385 RepID=UPI002479703B|nr:G-box-binding factor-like [Uranotaenia lowii]
MKPLVWTIVLVVLLVELAYAEPEPVTPDIRKARHPASGPTSYNTISVQDSENLSKLQNTVAPSVQIPLKPIVAGPTKAPDSHAQHNSGYATLPVHSPVASAVIQPGGSPYYFMTPQQAGNQVLPPATTPLIMQYITPQGQPTGGLQYIQLLRPVLYPYHHGAPYVQPSYVQQHQQQVAAISQQQQQPQQQHSSSVSQLHQHQHPHHQHTLTHHYSAIPTSAPTSPPSSHAHSHSHSLQTSTTQSSFVPFQPSSLQQYSVVGAGAVAAPGVTSVSGHPGTHPVAAAASTAALTASSPYAGPIAQYSSPVLTYYQPRISLINGPDMSLNTNEYMPPGGDHFYSKGVKGVRA